MAKKNGATTNIQGLRDVLYVQIDGLRDGSVDPKIANSISNASSKILSTVKLELQYLKMIGKSITANTVKGMIR